MPVGEHLYVPEMGQAKDEAPSPRESSPWVPASATETGLRAAEKHTAQGSGGPAQLLGPQPNQRAARVRCSYYTY